METLLQQIASGVSMGMIYGGVALAFVVVYQSTHHLNFAQGEMATFTTFVAWWLLGAGWPYWVVLPLTAALGFALGALVDLAIMRRLPPSSPLATVIVTVGLLMLFNSASGYLFDYSSRAFPSPFEALLPATRFLSAHELGTFLVVLILVLLLYVLFRFTWFGLAMRGAVVNPMSASMVGVSVNAMRTAGWGIAGAIGAVTGMLVAPIVFLEPNMMMGVLVYGFAASLLGGLANPWGAILGGIIVGVLENLLGTYVIGTDLKLSVALLTVIVVLLVRPAGLLGRGAVRRM
ncbi:MAG: branched-chain amino acid ABC transporter permease [Burkholderiales bacterium]